jgi:hypothetical protein
MSIDELLQPPYIFRGQRRLPMFDDEIQPPFVEQHVGKALCPQMGRYVILTGRTIRVRPIKIQQMGPVVQNGIRLGGAWTVVASWLP